MIVFIKLVKRASILHEKFFIYKKQINNTILSGYNHTTIQTTKLTILTHNTNQIILNKQLQNTFKKNKNNQTHQTNKQLNNTNNYKNKLIHTPPLTLRPYMITKHTKHTK